MERVDLSLLEDFINSYLFMCIVNKLPESLVLQDAQLVRPKAVLLHISGQQDELIQEKATLKGMKNPSQNSPAVLLPPSAASPLKRPLPTHIPLMVELLHGHPLW